MSAAASDRSARLAAARLYFVSDQRPGGRSLEPVLDAACRGGVAIFQLRMKQASDEEILAVAARARVICERHGTLFLINDRADLAAAVAADGVHIGQQDGDLKAARALVGPDALIGRSTHTASQAATAAAAADYFAVGPVYATPTKPGRPAVGTDLVATVADQSHAATPPWFAIGGIDGTTIDPVLNAGADRVVVVRAIAEADEPEIAARTLNAAIAARLNR